MRRYRIALVLAFLMVCFSGFAFADEARQFGSDLDEIELEFLKMDSEFEQMVNLERVTTLERRLQDGIIMLEGGDYERASYAFLDILEHREWAQETGYHTAKLYLSRTLYETGYYRMAQRYLSELIPVCRGTECEESMSLLLQVAQQTEDWEAVNDALSQVGSSLKAAGLGDVYDYIIGRSYFLQGDIESSRRCLERISGETEWSMKAHYLLGILLVQEEKYEEALKEFSAAAESNAEFSKKDQVKDLSVIAIARLYYELGDWSAALDNYQRVSENSEYFSDVLYELTWTHLRRGEMTAAQQSLELLLLSYPNSTYSLEGRRLKADIERNLGNYDEAVNGYHGILDEFEPVMRKMKAEESRKDEIVARVIDSIDQGDFDNVEIVPYAARDLVARDKASQAVDGMLKGLTRSADNTATSRQIINEIEQIMSSDMKFGIFSEYQKYWEKSREMRVRLVNIGASINEYVVGDDTAYSSERKELSKRLSALPQSQQDIAIRASQRDAALVKRRGDLYQLKLKADSLQHRINIIQSWLRSNGSASLTKAERTQIEEGLASLTEELKALQAREQELGVKISTMRIVGGISGSEVNAETEMISRLDSLVDEEWSKNANNSRAQSVSKLQMRQKSLQNSLNQFDQKLERAVDQRIASFRERLNREARLVDEESERFDDSKALVGKAAGEIAIHYWDEVFDLVHEMVLGADLGIVDVAWLKKDEKTKKLNDLINERGKERNIMEQDFNHYMEAISMKAAVDAAPTEAEMKAAAENADAPAAGTETAETSETEQK